MRPATRTPLVTHRADWTPQRPLEPMQQLAAAVISRALDDARLGCPHARAWLLENREDFGFWCDVAGLSVGVVRDAIRQVLEGEHDDDKQAA